MYQQQDERWGSIPLGRRGGETISTAGCLLNVGAEMLNEEMPKGLVIGKGLTNEEWKNAFNEYKKRTPNFVNEPMVLSSAPAIKYIGLPQYDPGTLNRWLCRNNGYTSGNLIVFSRLGEPAGLAVEVIDCSRRSAPMDKIQAALDAGGYPLVKVDFKPGGSVQQHWVRILELTDDDALIHDPWLLDGGPYWLMARYGHWTWDDVARAVYRVALYTKRPDSITADNLEDILETERRYFRDGEIHLAQCSLSTRSRSLRSRLAVRVRGMWREARAREARQ